MAQLKQPQQFDEFYGVVTSGHPLRRPVTAAKVCENWRVMPGQWLRLRSGRKARMYNETGSFLQFFENYKQGDKLAQWHDGTGPTWQDFSVAPWWSFDPFFDYGITTSFGGTFAATEAAPVVKIQTRVAFYNGFGVRDSTKSRPPFTTSTRYFGIDAHCPSANPSASFVAGAGYNTVVNSLQVFVGLHNATTGHYSNGVYAGTISTSTESGTITVSNLSNLKATYHDNTERDELKYVFYSTIDGGAIPYLILNAALNDSHQVAVTATTASLSLYSGGNGFVLNLDAPMPTDNHPPRPMRDVAYVNGRLYGVALGDGGSGSAVLQQRADGTQGLDFTYVPPSSRLAGLVYSKAVSDGTIKQMIGNHEESWPLNNFTPTPNSEIPIKVAPAPDGYKVLVITATESFLVEESLDRVHEWTAIGQLNGIARKACIATTPYGTVWLTQRNELVLLRKGAENIEIISREYQSILSGRTARFLIYVNDPLNETDRIEVYFTDGESVIHDFRLITEYLPFGQAYTATGQDYTAAATLTDTDGKQHHVVASTHVYTREGQVDEDGAIVTYDEDYTGPTTKAKTNFSGTYERQWDDRGDDSVRWDTPHVDLVGDPETKLEWYVDHQNVIDANKKFNYTPMRRPQSETYNCWRYKMEKCHKILLKLVFKLTGNYSLGLTYDHPSEQGSLAQNFLGCIAKLSIFNGNQVNRP